MEPVNCVGFAFFAMLLSNSCRANSALQELNEESQKEVILEEKDKLLQLLNLSVAPSKNEFARNFSPFLVKRHKQVFGRSRNVDFSTNSNLTSVIEAGVFLVGLPVDESLLLELECTVGNVVCFSVLTPKRFPKSAEAFVWVRTRNANAATVQIVISDFYSTQQSETKRNMIRFTKRIEADEAWMKLPVTSLVAEWPQMELRNIKMEIQNCDDCPVRLETEIHLPINQPFIEFSPTVSPHPRQRRAAEQTSNTTCVSEDFDRCCLHQVLISFEAMGWDHWILDPKSFHVNFCSGNCPVTNTDSYSAVMTAYRRSRELNGLSNGEDSIPCCAPKKMAPLTITYKLDDESIHVETIENFIVQQCGCGLSQ